MASADQEGTSISGTSHRLSIGLLIVVALMLGTLAACASGNATGNDPDEGEPINVVVTMPFMPSMVDAVGGEYVEIESIVPQGADAHTYQPTPGNARLIADADAIFVNGLGLEAFLDGLLESAGGVDAPIYELTDSLQDHGIESEDHHHDDHGHDDDHQHEFGNPHFWLNPEFGIDYIENIYQGLSEIDPENEAAYRENADNYIAELESLDAWAEEQMARLPEENRSMVTFHDAFPYFADRYGLEIVGVIVSSPGREPGAQEMADLVDQIRSADVSAVFIEPQFNPALAEAIADEAGVETIVIYSDTPPEGVGYLEMLKRNVERVVEGLSES